jgi:hypothetical protein
VDKGKRAQLIATARAQGYPASNGRVVVTRSQFFDGNDDSGSIGCNLPNHPGVAAFAATLEWIEHMDGVAGVYLAITEIDETYDSIWPFTDTALFVTRLPASAFEGVLRPLEPDEIARSQEAFVNPPAMPEGYYVVHAWWD